MKAKQGSAAKLLDRLPDTETKINIQKYEAKLADLEARQLVRAGKA